MCHRRPFRSLLYQLKCRERGARPDAPCSGVDILPGVILAFSSGLILPIVVIIGALALLAILLRSA
jgi:hypothetical protein